MPVQPRLQVEGVRELNKVLKAAGGKELQKQLGQVHKSIGQMVIDRLGGAHTGVGSGAGERIRPSAATREVLLRVGGGHRGSDPRKLQWGRVQKWPGGQKPHRPHLIQAAVEIEADIERTYLAGVGKIFESVGMRSGWRPF